MPIDLNAFDPQVIANDHATLTILAPLLQGAQKRVWHVRFQNTDFVLKVYGDEPQTSSRAQREVEILGRCSSVNLAAVGPLPLTRKVITLPDDAVLYYLEEFIPGRSLDREPKPFPTNEVVQLGIHISDAIGILSAHGFLHRDIKPANIMKRAPEHYVLIDVGLALDYSGLSITRTGHTVGTPGYLSPEQLQMSKRGLDLRSDLFALGVVLYECATAVHPFWNAATPMMDVKFNILAINPQDPRAFNPNVPAALASIILRLLAKERHLRYGRIDQVQSDLGKVQ